MKKAENSAYPCLKKLGLLSLVMLLSILIVIAPPPPPSNNGWSLPPGGRPPACALNPVPNISGSWKMVANVQYQFDLELQQNGRDFTGTMTLTNGQEPVDTVNGSVSPCAGLEFIRNRQGSFIQQYKGKVLGSGRDLHLQGNFTHNGAGQYPWSASKVYEINQSVTSKLDVNLTASESNLTAKVAKARSNLLKSPIRISPSIDIAHFVPYDTSNNTNL